MVDQLQREEEINCRGRRAAWQTSLRERRRPTAGERRVAWQISFRERRRSTAGERRAVWQISLRERRRPTVGERRAVRRSPGCWVEELLCARVEPTAAV